MSRADATNRCRSGIAEGKPAGPAQRSAGATGTRSGRTRRRHRSVSCRPEAIRRLKSSAKNRHTTTRRPTYRARRPRRRIRLRATTRVTLLLEVFRAWKALRDKKLKLQEAQQDAVNDQETLAKQHGALIAAAQQTSESRESAKQQAKGFANNRQNVEPR